LVLREKEQVSDGVLNSGDSFHGPAATLALDSVVGFVKSAYQTIGFWCNRPRWLSS
jgi:hypothetical protein